jgi:16S rRNA processing protein RimM
VLVTVGRIGKPHGIRGEVTVEPFTDEPDIRFAAGAELSRIGADPLDVVPLIVAASHWHSGRLLVKFVGCDDRNSAEELRGTILSVERTEDQTPVDPSEFYDSNLIGCSVYTKGGEVVGEVTDVLHLPSQDLLTVTNVFGEDILIPFVEEIVPIVDVANKKIVITPPEGLISEGETESPDSAN